LYSWINIAPLGSCGLRRDERSDASFDSDLTVQNARWRVVGAAAAFADIGGLMLIRGGWTRSVSAQHPLDNQKFWAGGIIGTPRFALVFGPTPWRRDVSNQSIRGKLQH